MNFPSFDTELLLYINQCNNVLMDNVMIRFSETWTWSLLLIAVVFVVLRDRPLTEALMILFGIALCVLAADQISSSIIKPWVARLRPTHDPELMFQIRHISGRAGQYGFVSSHAANTFAVAVFVSLLIKSWPLSITMILWAALNAYSRIYLGVHYPGDILFGTLTGVGVGVLVYFLYYYLKEKFLSRPQYISNQYTSSGYLTSDISILLTVMAITVLVILIYGMILGNLLNF